MSGLTNPLRRGSNDSEIGGAEAVFAAILDHSDTQQRYTVTFGEPKLIERGGEFNSSYRIKVPTFSGEDEPGTSPLEFELPEGEDELLESAFADLLEKLELDPLDGIKQVEGETATATLDSGTLQLRYDLEEEVGV